MGQIVAGGMALAQLLAYCGNSLLSRLELYGVISHLTNNQCRYVNGENRCRVYQFVKAFSIYCILGSQDGPLKIPSPSSYAFRLSPPTLIQLSYDVICAQPVVVPVLTPKLLTRAT